MTPGNARDGSYLTAPPGLVQRVCRYQFSGSTISIVLGDPTRGGALLAQDNSNLLAPTGVSVLLTGSLRRVAIRLPDTLLASLLARDHLPTVTDPPRCDYVDVDVDVDGDGDVDL